MWTTTRHLDLFHPSCPALHILCIQFSFNLPDIHWIYRTLSSMSSTFHTTVIISSSYIQPFSSHTQVRENYTFHFLVYCQQFMVKLLITIIHTITHNYCTNVSPLMSKSVVQQTLNTRQLNLCLGRASSWIRTLVSYMYTYPLCIQEHLNISTSQMNPRHKCDWET